VRLGENYAKSYGLLRRRFAMDKAMPITEFAFLGFGGSAGKFKT
jgi:hypothetical protein